MMIDQDIDYVNDTYHIEGRTAGEQARQRQARCVTGIVVDGCMKKRSGSWFMEWMGWDVDDS